MPDNESQELPLVKGAPANAAAGGASAQLVGLQGRCTCSVEEAAEVLGIGRSTAYAAARDGSLPVIRVCHRLLVPTAKLLAMVGVEAASACLGCGDQAPRECRVNEDSSLDR